MKSFYIHIELLFFYPIISYLPVKLAYKLATVKGVVDCYIFPEKINAYVLGLKQFGKLDENSHIKLAKAQHRMLAREKMDVYFLSKMNAKNIEKFIQLSDIENFINAKKSGRPVILYTAHFGRSIMPTIALGILGYKITILTVPVSGSKIETWYLNKKLDAISSIIKGGIVHTNQPVRNLYKTIGKMDEILTIAIDVPPVPDQAYYESDFLQGKARFPKGIVKMAKKMDALLVPFFSLEHEGYLSGQFLPAISTTNLSELEIFKQVIIPIEQKIEMYPEQWWAWPWLTSFWKKNINN